MIVNGSQSEDNGIALLHNDDLQVYSVGISTGGIAEIRMAEANPGRHIIATTIDKEGLAFAQKIIEEKGFADQIEAKIEDVSQPLPYTDNHFDYIYARLVLHYLSKDSLVTALAELYRVLKEQGRLFVVVRSARCPDALNKDAVYDPNTRLTTCPHIDPKTGKYNTSKRYYHTEESIRQHVTDANFTVAYTKEYDERLFIDFMRTHKQPYTDNIIELMASK